MDWLRKFINRRRLKYVGTVEGVTQFVDSDGKVKAGGTDVSHWLLYESETGRRRCQRLGTQEAMWMSASAKKQKADVEAWLRGGPLPPKIQTPPPEIPIDRPELIAFSGGKA
ncbi:hypothetical protein [Brucella intermedia]|uniref:hypothetical protein n=1 Tax=Brucella intermedia TaxID=94625 RepID=UPI0023630B6A|nr:hypothetical protein [Brucella intermedia]